MSNYKIIRIDLGNVNCYLLKQDNNFILFDTGGCTIFDKKPTNKRDILIKKLNQSGCKPGNLKLIILTHGDFDHTFNAKHIRDHYNAPIAIHPNDLKLVQNPNIKMLNDSVDLSHYSKFIFKIIIFLMKSKIKNIFHHVITNFETFTPDLLINESFNLMDYGFNGKVLHLPGHTDGSIGIVIDNRHIIVGDTMTSIMKPSIAPNAMDFNTLEKSIQIIKDLNIEFVYPGHGKSFNFNKYKN